MNDYTDFTEYYDALMTSGYYDYGSIARTLISILQDRRKVIELGVGTGLLAEKLLQYNPKIQFTGIDFTASMLVKAKERLGMKAILLQKDVMTMEMGERYEAAYGNGGVWGFVNTGTEYILVSHLTDIEKNLKGLRSVARHLEDKGLLIMSVQGVHKNFERELPDRLVYSQAVFEGEDFIEKDYIFKRDGVLVGKHRNRFKLFRGTSIY
jgi:predicted TPR repeat methyltransferase